MTDVVESRCSIDEFSPNGSSHPASRRRCGRVERRSPRLRRECRHGTAGRSKIPPTQEGFKLSACNVAALDGFNRQFVLVARPVGMPKESDFRLVEGPLRGLSPGELLLRTLFLSVDPYMRSRMSGIKSYADPVAIGQVMVGAAVGIVVKSCNPAFHVEDIVEGPWGWQEFAISDGKHLRKLDPGIAPVSTALGLLGMPGLTAYFGLQEVCKPKPGETLVVSGAAGAVGSLVGQLAKMAGCRVIGIAGSDEKVAWLVDDLGFDGAFNYKTTANFVVRLRALCPLGVDLYFDNVGGIVTDAVFAVLNSRARVCVCGQSSQYNLEKPEAGPRHLIYLLAKQIRAEGFLVDQFEDRYREGLDRMASWLRESKLKYKEHVVEGFRYTPKAFVGMLRGENMGKALVKVSDI
jgi:NADPH:quinone reductase